MTGVDITLTQTSNNINTDVFDVPFIEVMNVNAKHITAVKELLMSIGDDLWLKQANEIVLKKLMSWKDK